MNIHYQRLNHVTVAVPAGEHEKARAFYGGVLGLAEIHRPDALGMSTISSGMSAWTF
jgi:catechol 2,3-dioxygenase-like lactoylglutathione lyase family enzyme